MAKTGQFKKWEMKAKGKSAPAFDPFAPPKEPRYAALVKAGKRRALGMAQAEYERAVVVQKKKRKTFLKAETDLWA